MLLYVVRSSHVFRIIAVAVWDTTLFVQCLSGNTCSANFQLGIAAYRFVSWHDFTLHSIFCLISLFNIAVSFCVYIFDVVTDLLLVLWYYYYRNQDPAYLLFFRLTLAFVVGPSLIVQVRYIYSQ